MIKGMTGFGTAEVNAGEVKGVIEIKSVNHRYLDLAFYLPIGFAAVENQIRQAISKAVSRGRITISFKITDKPEPKISLNKNAVRQYLVYARGLKKEFHLDNELNISDIIKLPGVVDARDVFVAPEKIWPAMEKALQRSVNSLDAMRKREGRALARDLNSVLRRMSKHIKNIELRAKNILKEKKKVLSLEEFSSFQKGVDINEELARLAHYIEEFKMLINATTDVGKKMDFIGQEMQRETNTIGSKVQDKIVSNCVISIKSKIEKLREQAQNIE
jgi:uncharacterized protein (TIGR00255 family)